MKKNEIIAKVTSAVNTATIKVKKHSPEILIVAGVVGTVASAVMACKATTKLSTVLEEHKKDVDAVHECSENEEIKADYSQEDLRMVHRHRRRITHFLMLTRWLSLRQQR